MRNIMAHTGDRVRIKSHNLTGRILRIRFDSNNDEIYTIEPDDPKLPLWVARHFELEWL